MGSRVKVAVKWVSATALDLKTQSRNPTEVNKTTALIGHCAFAAGKNSA